MPNEALNSLVNMLIVFIQFD